MNLKTRMGIGVLALSVGFLAAAQPAEATNRGTQNGDESKECSALWRAETVLDADLTNDDAEYPDLMVDFAGDPVHYTNGGYIREVTPALKNSGMLEINHFYVGSGANLAQVWRIPTATKDAIKDARVTVKLPPAVVTGGYKVTFDAVSVNSRISAWGDNYSGFEWAERASKFVENTPLNSSLNTVRQRLQGAEAPALEQDAAAPVPHRPALAAPPVRLAAKEMGVDLANVTATGSRGQVTKQDLLDYVAHLNDVQETGGRFWQSPSVLGDRLERIPVRGVRKATAKAMVSSAFSAPHVSIFVDVDASRTMEFVKRLKKSRHFEGIKVTPLLVLAAAVIWAAERNPQVNATWTDSEIQIKHFMNLGIAAATPRGLMVPNIKDAQELSLRELAIALNNLTARAREGKTQPAEMANGTLTITNIGSLGIDTGTPIINPGEVAIIAFGTIKQKPWVVDGEVIPRWVTTLGGSFDHRVVDGDLSARFMADVAAILEEPAMLLDI